LTKISKLVGPDGRRYESNVPGTLGGHSGRRIYGRLDCAAALRAIARGGYVSQRVFFLNMAHAQAAGYRPCGTCLPDSYARWKERQD
jgi:hypothetical protein